MTERILSDGDARVIELLLVCLSIFSALGSLFIIGSYLRFPHLRSFAFKLVVCLSISDVFFSIGAGLGDAGGSEDTHLGANPDLCRLQAWMMSMFGLSSVMWAVSVAFTLHMMVVRQHPSWQDPGRWLLHYHLVCWGIPFVFSLLPLTTSSFGDTGGWCWIMNITATDNMWRYVQLYIPLWIGVCYSVYVSWRLHQHNLYLKRFIMSCQADQAAGTHPDAGQEGKGLEYVDAPNAAMSERLEMCRRTIRFIGRMRYYPLVLIVCYLFATINTVYETIASSAEDSDSPGRPVMWLTVLHVSFATLQGFFNAIAYGTTTGVCGACCRRNESHVQNVAAGAATGTDGAFSPLQESTSGFRESKAAVEMGVLGRDPVLDFGAAISDEDPFGEDESEPAVDGGAMCSDSEGVVLGEGDRWMDSVGEGLQLRRDTDGL